MKELFNRVNFAALLFSCILIGAAYAFRSYMTNAPALIFALLGGAAVIGSLIVTLLQWLLPFPSLSRLSWKEHWLAIPIFVITVLIIFIMVAQPIADATGPRVQKTPVTTPSSPTVFITPPITPHPSVPSPTPPKPKPTPTSIPSVPTPYTTPTQPPPVPTQPLSNPTPVPTPAPQWTSVAIPFTNLSAWEASYQGTDSDCYYDTNDYNYYDNQIKTNNGNPCIVINPKSFTNVEFKVTLQIQASGDCGGVVFRYQANRIQYDGLTICSDGTEDLFETDASTNIHPIDQRTIQPTSNQTYTVEVDAIGNSVTTFINGQAGPTGNVSYQSGTVGVYTEAKSNPTQVAFVNPTLLTRN